MLTNHDLSQIKNVVHSAIQEETPAIVRKIIREETRPIIQEELQPIKKDIKKIKNDLDLVARSLDRDLMSLRKKVDKHIAEHSVTIN